MIAPASANHWQTRFLTMLPNIHTRARVAFCGMDAEARQDAISEVVARAYLDYARLVERNMEHVAFPSVLAGYAIRQYLSGRRVGTKVNSGDVHSKTAQRKNGHELVEIGSPGEQNAGGWQEILVENRLTPPPDQAAFRIDFSTWLNTLIDRDRQIAEELAVGESGKDVSERHGISQGRVSQLRGELHDTWVAFHGEMAEEKA